MVGDRFSVSPHEAKLLASKSLVLIETEDVLEENPTAAAGEKSSVSPAAPALPNPTAKPPKRGRPRKKIAE